MATRVCISGPAREDLSAILATSLERDGEQGRARYAALLSAAMESIARDPDGPTTCDRRELLPGVRSFHLRDARRGHDVHAPIHVVFYRPAGSVVEIVRVVHERIEPARHVITTRTQPGNPGRRRT